MFRNTPCLQRSKYSNSLQTVNERPYAFPWPTRSFTCQITYQLVFYASRRGGAAHSFNCSYTPFTASLWTARIPYWLQNNVFRGVTIALPWPASFRTSGHEKQVFRAASLFVTRTQPLEIKRRFTRNYRTRPDAEYGFHAYVPKYWQLLLRCFFALRIVKKLVEQTRNRDK